MRSIFTRDHPGTGDERLAEAFADAIPALDDSVPIGTYIDLCRHLPILRGEYDGIASFEDLLNFFARLPHPDKQFVVMQGISHASLQQKNRRIMLHLLANFFAQPPAIYPGSASAARFASTIKSKDTSMAHWGPPPGWPNNRLICATG